MTKKRQRLYKSLIIAYSLLVLYWMFVSFGRSGQDFDYRMNLVPFKTIKQLFSNFRYYNFGVWLVNFLGNIIVFIPYGYLVPKIVPIKGMQLLFGGFVLLFGVECLQLLLQRGIFDVDDIILNLIGIMCGYGTLLIERAYHLGRDSRDET